MCNNQNCPQTFPPARIVLLVGFQKCTKGAHSFLGICPVEEIYAIVAGIHLLFAGFCRRGRVPFGECGAKRNAFFKSHQRLFLDQFEQG